MNKSNSILFILFFCFCVKVHSQSDTTFVPFVAYWEVGDEYNFRVTKIKEQWKAENKTKYDSSAYTTKFKVLEATDTSYLINWTYENQLASGLQLPSELEEDLSDFNFTSVLYTTNELGTFEGIQNWEEISDVTNKVIDAILTYTRDNSEGEIDESDFRNAMQPFTQAYSSKEGIERLVLSELQYFHFPFGLEYPAKDTVYYEEQLPNMFGGNPIRADIKLYFEEIDFENSISSMIQKSTLNSEDTRDVLLGVLKSMNFPEAELEKEFENSVFNINDFNRYEFYFYPGVPIKIETRRKTFINISSDPGTRIDRTIIELIN